VARKLKTYQTSAGFYDLAIAAPSMKAALEAWGSKSNLFHQGFASEATNPRVITAAMKKPGVILRRAVGSSDPFTEHPALPTNLLDGHKAKPAKSRKVPKAQPSAKLDGKAARKAALAFEKEQRHRETVQRKEEAAAAKERERRHQAFAKAEKAIDDARHEHDRRANIIERERAGLDRRAEQEDERWEKAKTHLEFAVRNARN
jgi:hypothetical protein